MKKFFKIIFNRSTLVIIAILLQLGLSFLLPYMIAHYYEVSFSRVFVPVDLVFTIIAIIVLIRLINSDMTIEGQLTWSIVLLIFPVFGVIIYFVFVRNRPPKRHTKYYKKVRNEVKQYQVKYKGEDEYLKSQLKDYYGQF